MHTRTHTHTCMHVHIHSLYSYCMHTIKIAYHVAFMKLNDDNHQSGAQIVSSVFNMLLWSLLVLFPFVQVLYACAVCTLYVWSPCLYNITVYIHFFSLDNAVLLCCIYSSLCHHQAARVSSYCSKLLKTAPTIRARSLLYQESTTAELDSFIMYASAIKMRVSIRDILAAVSVRHCAK